MQSRKENSQIIAHLLPCLRPVLLLESERRNSPFFSLSGHRWLVNNIFVHQIRAHYFALEFILSHVFLEIGAFKPPGERLKHGTWQRQRSKFQMQLGKLREGESFFC